MIPASEVSAVIVTRGDVDLAEVLAPYLTFDIHVVVWDNSVLENLSVYGRYAAIGLTAAPVIITQDDDCVLPPGSIEALLDAYQPGHIVANMPERFREHYPDSCLVGFGAVFDRDLPAQAFERVGLHELCSPFPEDTDWTNLRFTQNGVTVEMPDASFFHRTCDVVFTTLTPRILVDVPVQILDYAYGEDRMYRQPEHVGERARMLQLARQVRDAVTA